MPLPRVIYETPSQRFHVVPMLNGNGYEVCEHRGTYAVKVGTIGFTGAEGIRRAIAEADRREALPPRLV